MDRRAQGVIGFTAVVLFLSQVSVAWAATAGEGFPDGREEPPPDNRLTEGPAIPVEEERTCVNWSQPPLEIDPNLDVPPVLCSYLQPSQSSFLPDGRQVSNIVADDFHSLGSAPVTGLRWWGFYKGHEKPKLPEIQPQGWRLTFWVNRPEPADANLFPEKMVWRLDIPFDRVRIEPVGMDDFPHPFSEMCFRFELALDPNEWFRQGEFPSEGNIYWVSVAAMYSADAPNRNHWGWATRPEVWSNPGQIVVLYGDGPDAKTKLWPEQLIPVTNSDLCGREQGYDMAFELLTDRDCV